MDNHGDLASCPNNCIGVDPNAVVVGGTALVASAAIGAVSVASIQAVGVGVGLLGLAALGGGSLVGGSGSCPPLYCRVSLDIAHSIIIISIFQVGTSCRLLGFSTSGIFCPSG